MQMLTRKSLIVWLAGAVMAAGAHAQEYPSKTVKIVVPFGAGGGTDTMARVVADSFQKELGQSFIIENRPGASGNIGLEQVAKAPNDGYTLVMITNNIATNPSLYENVKYDPIKDFAPIALVGSSPVAIAVHPDTGFKNMKDLVAYAKANPGKLSYTSCGSAAPQHLAAELLSQETNTKMIHVPYKGCAQGIPDHIAGRVPVAFSTIANLSPHVKAGKTNIIAVTGAKRSPYMPDVPTVGEALGLKDYNIDVWFALFAPAGTPKPVISRLNGIVNAALSSPKVKEQMAAQNYDILGGTPEELAETVKRDIVRYEKVIRTANIKPE